MKKSVLLVILPLLCEGLKTSKEEDEICDLDLQERLVIITSENGQHFSPTIIVKPK